MSVTFNPSSVGFGDTMLDASGTKTFSVTNSDAAHPVTLACAGAGFTCSPSTVAAGSTVNVVVTFTPTATGLFTGTLTDSSSSPTTASFTGNGVLDDSETDSTGTRFRVDVPTPNVLMTLGKGVDRSTYDGFGVTAPSDNVFFNAGAQFWAQSSDDFTLQSTKGNVASLAEESNFVFGKSNAAVIGGSGTFIGAGLHLDPVVADGHTDLQQQGVKTLSTGTTTASASFGAFDLFLGGAQIMRGIHEFKKLTWLGEPGHKIFDNVMSMAAIAASLAGAVLGVLDVASNAEALRGKDASPDLPGVTIYGRAGILMGTPGFASIYAVGGLCMGSLFMSIAAIDTEILGIRSATMTAFRDANINGSKKVKVTSDKVHIDAKKELKLRAGSHVPVPQTYDMVLTPSSITLKKEVTRLPEKVAIEMTDYDITTSHPRGIFAKSGTCALSVTSTSVGMSEDSGVNMVNMTAGGIDIFHSGKITIQASFGSAAIDLAAGNAAVKGNRILLG